MNQDKNRKIISITTIILLLIVTIIGITLYVDNNKEKNIVSLRQLYVADNKLNHLIDNYFYTTVANDTIIIKADEYETTIPYNIEYDNIYKTLDNQYLLYKNENDHFKVVSFDGHSFNTIYDLEGNVEPLLYTESNENYILGFKKTIDNQITLYSINSNNPITLDDIEDLVVVTKEYYLIKRNNKYGIINQNGETIINPIYNNIEVTDNNLFIVQNNKKMYGIIDKDEKTIITFKYNYITKKDKYYLIVNSANKLSLLDEELNTIIYYQMNYNQSSNSLDLFENNNRLFIINNKNEKNKKINYQYHDMYVIENKKIKEVIAEEQVFYSNNNIYYIKDNNLLSYDGTANLKIDNISNDIINVKNIKDNIIEVTIYDNNTEKHKYYDKSFKEIMPNSNDIIYNDGNIIMISEDDSIKIIDNDGNTLKEIKGTNIVYNNDYVIVDNCLYKIMIK